MILNNIANKSIFSSVGTLIKEEDIEKFKSGELVEPKKQIVYYVDRATPEKWRKYITR